MATNGTNRVSLRDYVSENKAKTGGTSSLLPISGFGSTLKSSFADGFNFSRSRKEDVSIEFEDDTEKLTNERKGTNNSQLHVLISLFRLVSIKRF